ncbi:ABC transporter permease [Miniphocaeibacter massiliensis]|uniref:ABC transporter permease n=1 Tax=Miniphocaeibacter massiliensis TaxID=2041841 RepID=UPI0013EBEEBB|nr:FtsX-like permease family protein [Miniphocaeibacter massiliensis]
MKIKDLLFTSLRNLWRRKVRTILTILGVLIGSTSIIIMLSMGFAMTKTNEAFMEEMGGLSTITVYPSDSYMSSTEDKQNSSKKAILNESTLKKIQKMEGVKTILPFMESQNYNISLLKGKDQAYAPIYAVDFSKINDYGFKIANGENPIKKEDVLVGGSVQFDKVIGEQFIPIDVDFLNDKIELKVESFSEEELEGKPKTYKINITGILEEAMDETGYSIFVSMDYFKEIVKELDKKSKEKTNLANYSYVKLEMEKDADFKVTQEKLKEEGYVTHSMTDYFNEIQDMTKNTRNMFLIVGAVAFVVAAIGIANTMIMSVYERTKEIGVMKVIGASIKDIKNMFLMEATFIGLIGGVLSIAFSYLVSYILNTTGMGLGGVTEMMMTGEGEKTLVSYIPFWLPFVGVVFSTIVGLVSGYLPSRRATKISAIEAIRSQ